MSKEDTFNFGLEGFKAYLRNKIKYQRENLKLDDLQTEATFYSDLKTLCEEYYVDLKLNNEQIVKEVNDISNTTRDLVKKRHEALNLKLLEAHQESKTEHQMALSK